MLKMPVTMTIRVVTNALLTMRSMCCSMTLRPQVERNFARRKVKRTRMPRIAAQAPAARVWIARTTSLKALAFGLAARSAAFSAESERPVSRRTENWPSATCNGGALLGLFYAQAASWGIPSPPLGASRRPPPRQHRHVPALHLRRPAPLPLADEQAAGERGHRELGGVGAGGDLGAPGVEPVADLSQVGRLVSDLGHDLDAQGGPP